MRGEKHQRLIDALETAAAEHGLELVDVELSGSGRARVIRVFLDHEGGIGIDELAAANLWVDATVEANEPYAGTYNLEVSSPGIDRPLRTLEHFARFAGAEARLTSEPVNGRGKWTGVLAGVEDEDVLLVIDGETHRVPHGKIRGAHLKGQVDFRKGSEGDASGAQGTKKARGTQVPKNAKSAKNAKNAKSANGTKGNESEERTEYVI